MKKKLQKKLIAAAAMSACLLLGAPAAADAAVSVTLPTFDVTLNGTVIENANRQYPLLVYKDITYVPMTYHDCRFLGLETTWSQKDGLGIIKSGMSGAYYEDTAAKKNNKKATAQVVTGKVAVNGKQINNSREQYPLLLYRDVTYFPLTWRYAVDEFGWKYHFDSKNGLVISSTNQKTDSVTLKDGRDAEYNGDINFDFAIDAKNLYYQGKKGEVYQRPLNDWGNDAKRNVVAEIPYEDMYFTGYPTARFKEQQGTVNYTYHTGGATMGGDVICRIDNKKNTTSVQEYGYGLYIDFGEFGIKLNRSFIGGPPMVPMIYIAEDGTTQELGPYGYYYSVNERGYDSKRNVLYVSANSNQLEGESYLYEVSLKDGSMKKISDKSHNGYAVTKDAVYFINNQQLYKKDLNTGIETLLASNMDQWTQFVVTEHGIYLGSAKVGEQLCFMDNSTGKITKLYGKGTLNNLSEDNGYVVALFTETTDNQTRILVFDSNGKQVYSSADVASKAVINADGVLVYRLAGTAQLVKVQL